MHDDHTQGRRAWRIPDERWDRLAPLLPPRQPHPLGCHRPRVADRQAMAAIFLVRRPGCPWHARHEPGLCSSRAAPRRVQAWAAAGAFLTLGQMGLADDDAWHGMDWAWRARAGALTKAPRGGQQVGKNPTARGTTGPTRRGLTDGGGVPSGLAVAGANRHAFKRTREPLERIAVKRPQPTPDTPQGRCLDNGDADEAGWARLAACGGTAQIRARGEEAKALKQEPGFRARRWVVERTPSGMHRVRRVLIHWDKNVRHEVACLHVAGA
jgi:putative transposase